ncbi:hypothetical protein WJX73_010091 [Symbiochloris irregularis]|uniref:Uncharacterized protein n=1 Tax=Symbiochloris irregularis TaxID=706552 RepID=A0AAW1PYT8_9CHLO
MLTATLNINCGHLDAAWLQQSVPLCSSVSFAAQRLQHRVRACLPQSPSAQSLYQKSGLFVSGSSSVTAQRAALHICRASKQLTDAEDAQDRRFVHALLLAWFAAPNRSVFPLRCLVETAMEMYRSGLWLQDLQLALSVATLESGGRLLAPIEQELALMWTGLVFMTMRELNAPLHSWAQRRSKGAPELEDSTPRLKGMRGFVQRMMAVHAEGMDSRRLLLQQAMAGSSLQEGQKGAQQSPTVGMMQQNSRLIVLTLEANGRPSKPHGEATAAPSQPADSAPSPSPPGSARPDITPARSAAVRLLVEFVGAVQGSLYSVTAFVDDAVDCYRRGFALNTPRQGNLSAPGWAWADPEGPDAALQASQLANFVSNTLRSQVEAQDSSQALQALKEHLAEAAESSEDSDSMRTQPAAVP